MRSASVHIYTDSDDRWQPLLVAHLFIWNDKYFDQPLPHLAIDWEDSSADAHFFLERTPANRRHLSFFVNIFFIAP